MVSGITPSLARDLEVCQNKEAPPIQEFGEVKVTIIPLARPLAVLEFEVEPLGLPLAAWLSAGPQTESGVGSTERWPPMLEFVRLATLGDQASPIVDQF